MKNPIDEYNDFFFRIKEKFVLTVQRYVSNSYELWIKVKDKVSSSMTEIKFSVGEFILEILYLIDNWLYNKLYGKDRDWKM